MGKKGSMPSYATVNDYIKNQPLEAQKILSELRSIIKETIQDSIEKPNCKVPTFILVHSDKKEIQLMIAGYKKFVSFYPFPTTMEKFADKLKDYKQGKGCVQFLFGESLPKDLIAQMIQFRKEELLAE